MSASRPLALCRSLSDSGFEVTAQGSDLARYNPYSQNDDAAVIRTAGGLKHNSLILDAISQPGDLIRAESRISVMDHSIGVLDMVLDSISRVLEIPLVDNNAEGCQHNDSAYDALTEAKSIVDFGDKDAVDQTDVKELACKNYVLQRPPEYADISQGDMLHLIDSIADVHKKLDMLTGKMNNFLLQKKPESDTQIVPPKGIEMALSQQYGKRIFERESMYVQLEQVYINMQRINFLHRPKKSFLQTCPPFSQPNTAPKKTADASTQIAMDFASELADLRARCSHLEEENTSLNKELKKLQEPEKKIHPVPAPRQPKPDKEPIYTVVNCLVGPPTTPSKDVRMTEVTYEWTIQNYIRQFRDQRSGLVDKTISAPFFITNNGYRARMEAFLDGDGCAKGSYFSVFFRILSSEMDDHLTWPLNLRITFILINQTDKPNEDFQSRRGVIEHSFPQPNSNGIYEHGLSDCWGLLNLVSHEKIQMEQFIRKDKLLLQCQVQILPTSQQSRRTTSNMSKVL